MKHRNDPLSNMDQNSLCFLDLPYDIREMIYELVLCSPQGHDYPEILDHRRKYGEILARSAEKYSRSMSLLRVSRRINLEAAHLLYSKTHFKFDDQGYQSHLQVYRSFMGEEPFLPVQIESFEPFLRCIGERNLQSIYRVTISISSACFLDHKTDLAPVPAGDVRYIVWDALKLLYPIKQQLDLTIDCTHMSLGFSSFLHVLEDVENDIETGDDVCSRTMILLRGLKVFTLIYPAESLDWNDEGDQWDDNGKTPPEEIARRLKRCMEVEVNLERKIGLIHKLAEESRDNIDGGLKIRDDLVAQKSQALAKVQAIERSIQEVDRVLARFR